MATGNPTNYFVHPLLRARGWQHRPQLDQVCDWWRGRGVGFQPAEKDDRKLEAYATGQGVCALIGIGGAGKTAIADRFLQLLPGVLPLDVNTPKNESLPTPNSVFVFSFYDAPNPEAFFAALASWLRATVPTVTFAEVSPSGRVSYHQMVYWLQNAPPGLLILDGLERIQEDGTRGGIFGRIADGNLRDFLTRLSQGWLPHLSALITSRFPLADLDEVSPTWYRPIDVEEIDLQTGIDLLRGRRVTGNDDQLAAIVENCGRHALTVDMAGGLLCEFHRGDPTTNLAIGTREEIEQAASSEQDPRRRAVLKQELRFAKVAGRYRQALEKRDKAALALLERVCLFRLGVDTETLASIFTGKGSQKAAGAALSRLNKKRLQEKLDLLVRMGLLEATETDQPRRPERSERHPEPSARHPERSEGSPEGPPRPTQAEILRSAQNDKRTLYSIHPAVRDGFLTGISRDAALAGHEAARKSLEVSLGDAPGENPSDPATLDLLEEIVHHTLSAGHVREAWDIYLNRIGGFENLGWRLGAYERGERICRAFAGGQSPEAIFRRAGDVSPLIASPQTPEKSGDSRPPLAPFTELPEATQVNFCANWAIYLQYLGRLAAAARCYQLVIEMTVRQKDWKNASQGNQNLCDVWLLSGRLRKGEEGSGKSEKDLSSFTLHTSPFSEALRLAELADDAAMRTASHAYRGHARALRGEIPAALADFCAVLALQHEGETHAPDRPLYDLRGVWHSHLLAGLGRHDEATQLTEANAEICIARFGAGDPFTPKCQLVLSSLSVESSTSSSSSAPSAEKLWTSARDWALARDAKEVLCWLYLVEVQHALARCAVRGSPDPAPSADRRSPRSGAGNQFPGDLRSIDTAGSETRAEHLAAARTALEAGLKIARDCGFGLYHIDLLLTRARLHLLDGRAAEALDDTRIALGDSSGGGGVPADAATGQPQLFAARAPECGYAWAIPTAIQLRAEALLLQAAQQVGADSFVPAKINELPVTGASSRSMPDAELRLEAPATLIDQAKQLLQEALDLWQPLHDPEPERPDQNFQLDGKPYNYKAAETHRILTDLEGGVLTRYPLDTMTEKEETVIAPVRENAFISYSHADAQWRDMLLKNLKPLVRTGSVTAWSDQQIKPGSQWYDEIQAALAATKVAVLLVTADFLASDFIWKEELKPLLDEADKGNVTILWVPVKASLVEATDLPNYQALGNPDKPLNGMTEAERDQAWVTICKTIQDALNA